MGRVKRIVWLPPESALCGLLLNTIRITLPNECAHTKACAGSERAWLGWGRVVLSASRAYYWGWLHGEGEVTATADSEKFWTIYSTNAQEENLTDTHGWTHKPMGITGSEGAETVSGARLRHILLDQLRDDSDKRTHRTAYCSKWTEDGCGRGFLAPPVSLRSKASGAMCVFILVQLSLWGQVSVYGPWQ